ncbi:hypothetical protein [Catelliglobosispora koreensis]|uniref:hypothetical protein n=1 Tax=Catelliglobosispora koreensis TaxID=129052 RepID=UPI00036F7984|nr:hypothetical protein [Catelliglobosispora koreensis]
MRWNTAYGSLVAVRYQNLNGRNWIELRATASLNQTGANTQEQASQLAIHVDLAIRRIALPPLKRPAPAVTKGPH